MSLRLFLEYNRSSTDRYNSGNAFNANNFEGNGYDEEDDFSENEYDDNAIRVDFNYTDVVKPPEGSFVFSTGDTSSSSGGNVDRGM